MAWHMSLSPSKPIPPGALASVFMLPVFMTTVTLASSAASTSARHQMRRKAIDLRISSGSRCVCRARACAAVIPPSTSMFASFLTSKAWQTMTKEVHLRTTLSKHRSAALPGHWRTAKTSSHTRRFGLAPPSASAATSSPHLAPQQCEANESAWPMHPLALTSGRSANRQRLCFVAGLMILSTTSKVAHSQQSYLLVNSTSASMVTPRLCEASPAAARCYCWKQSTSLCRLRYLSRSFA